MVQNARADLVEVAGQLFSQKGFYGTSIRDIASARGIRSGSLYAHIDSKEDLLFDVVMAGSVAFIDALTPILSQADRADVKLVKGIAAHINVVATHLDTSRVFLHEWLLLSPERRAAIQMQRDRYEAMWTEIIQQGVDDGIFSGLVVRYARLVLLSVANWVYLWYDPNGGLDPDQMAEMLGHVLLDGFRMRGQAELMPDDIEQGLVHI
jgi:AcrR family transcriptional regulator